MKTLLSLASFAAGVAALSYSSAAHAIGPVDIEIAARGGYATNPSSSDFPANPYGGGIGGRAGVSIFGLYGGVSGIYYFGGSGSGAQSGASLHTGMEGFELGYTLPIPFVKIRPEVGVGSSTITISDGPLKSSTSNLYLEPGVLVFVPFGHFFVGADVNALILPSVEGVSLTGGNKTYVSLSVHGQLGVRF